MKTLKKLIIWALIGIIIEGSGFIYINNYYLTKKLVVSSKTIVNAQPVEEELFKLSGDIKDIKISDDGKYAAYLQDGHVVSVDLTTKKEEIVTDDNDYDLQFFNWMPYKNEVYYVEKSKTGQGLYKLRSYLTAAHKVSLDVKLDLKKVILDSSDSKSLSSQDKAQNIINIKTSSGLEGFIMQTDNSNKDHSLYFLNRNSEFILLHPNDMNNNANEKIIKTLPLDMGWSFLFQKDNDNKIYASVSSLTGKLSGKSRSLHILSGCLNKLLNVTKVEDLYSSLYLHLDNITDATLLQKDRQGNLYVGALKDKLVNEIYVYAIYGDDPTPKIYKLDNSIDEKKLLITAEGDIYAISDTKILNLKSKKSTEYSGSFVNIVGKKIYYNSNGYLKRKAI